MQRSSYLLNDAASIARIGCFEWEIEKGRSNWSREMYQILGLDPEEIDEDIKATVAFEMIHLDDLDHVRENHIRGLAKHRSIPSEFRVIRPDKSVVTLYASGKLELDESGSLYACWEHARISQSASRPKKTHAEATSSTSW